MSSKPSTSKKDNTTVLTRHKSAQMKRQLRTNDASIRRISQFTRLLMSPTREKTPRSPKTSPKGRKSAKTSPKKLGKEKKSQSELTKYYPDKLKRNVKKSKIVIRDSSKQKKKSGSGEKMMIPLEERPRSPSLPWLLSAADDSLDDDSLMEILTADSPVWWDDPPDHTYTEEPICILSREEVEYMIKQSQSMDTDDFHHETNKQMDITIKKTDETFMKKRNKLENLLGNIKNKLNNENTDERDRNIVNIKEEIKMEIDNHETDLQEFKGMSNIKNEKDNTVDVKDVQESVCSIRNSESSDVTNEEMIKDLENIQIPIEKDNSNHCEIDEKTFLDQVKDNVDRNDNVKEDLSKKIDNVEKVDNVDLKVNEVKASKELVDKSKAKFTISSIEISSPTPSVRSVISDTSEISSLVSTSDNLDTISDTNIKFLEEDASGKIVEIQKEGNMEDGKNTEKEKTQKDVKEHKDKNVSKQKEEGKQRKTKIDKEQLMTVYKIITDDSYREQMQLKNNKSQINDLTNTNIDTFCKKMKNNQQKQRKTEIFNQNTANVTNMEKDSKNQKEEKPCVSEDSSMNIASDVKTAKYCKKCSSIFESEKCVYCIQKAKISGVEYQCCTVTLKT